MKKRIILLISFMIFIIIIGTFIGIKTNNIKKESSNTISNIDLENVNITTQSFTITDTQTEISIKIENLKDTDISIKGIEITLLDSNNETIKTQQENISAEIKANESTIITIDLEEKYTNVSEIKYEILS